MFSWSMLPVRQKVYTYILCQNKLLVFQHVDFPEAGIQVPGGTVESGEIPYEAAIREAHEESGFDDLILKQKLGIVYRDMREFGFEEIHERHYFHFIFKVSPAQTWIGYEHFPSDGTQGPIKFRFFWVLINKIPPLAGKTDDMLPMLFHSMDT